MKKLPLKHKKTIIAFCKEYKALGIRRTLVVDKLTIKNIKVDICWDSDDSISISERPTLRDISHYIEKSPQVIKINRKIKAFVKRTTQFGQKYFKEKDWMWFNLLWDYSPENGDKYDFKTVKWVEDYKD